MSLSQRCGKQTGFGRAVQGTENCPGAGGRISFRLRLRARGLFPSVAFALIALAGMGHASAPAAIAQVPSEFQVKAAFLYNFTKFIEWPTDASTGSGNHLAVCVIGSDPFDHALENVVRGKSLYGKPFEVRHVTSGVEGRSCQVLFVCSSERKKVRLILEGLKGASVLTVSDTEDDTAHECIIDFLLEDNKVRFQINLSAANQANLRVSSKLLSLAKVVWD